MSQLDHKSACYAVTCATLADVLREIAEDPAAS
jgi:uncharacterized protein (UPF0147 family)